jgi:transposase-like protein
MDLQNQVKPRKFLTPDQKFKIVKEQMMTKTSVADICKKYDIVPSAFYRYQEQFLAGALDAFKSPKGGPTKAELRQIEALEKDNSRMKSVISEIIFENVDLKKRCGELGLIE